MASDYYGEVAGAFDRAAPDYDAVYRDNPIMAWMRAESLAVLQAAFPPGSRLLEIGCGTGDEALALGRLGHRIVATDVSPAMIEVARAKAQADGVGSVTWRVLPAGRLADLDLEPGSLEGAYSNFGALNCEPKLAPVAENLARLLCPGAPLVCSVMNRWCAWELVWGLLHLRPREATRRLGSGWVEAGLASAEGRLAVPTRFYSPRTFAQALAPYFCVQRVRGLPTLLPPPYLDHLAQRHPDLLNWLTVLERRLRDRFPFHSLGDHFLATMVRTEREAP